MDALENNVELKEVRHVGGFFDIGKRSLVTSFTLAEVDPSPVYSGVSGYSPSTHLPALFSQSSTILLGAVVAISVDFRSFESGEPF